MLSSKVIMAYAARACFACVRPGEASHHPSFGLGGFTFTMSHFGEFVSVSMNLYGVLGARGVPAKANARVCFLVLVTFS